MPTCSLTGGFESVNSNLGAAAYQMKKPPEMFRRLVGVL
jgi:hypothetical protein